MDNYTNSFVISFAVIGITYFIKSKLIWPMFAWPFHIVLDFAFHTKDLFPIQLFWPISSFFIDGISWSHPLIWYPNFAGILILFLWRYKIIFK